MVALGIFVLSIVFLVALLTVNPGSTAVWMVVLIMMLGSGLVIFLRHRTLLFAIRARLFGNVSYSSKGRYVLLGTIGLIVIFTAIMVVSSMFRTPDDLRQPSAASSTTSRVPTLQAAEQHTLDPATGFAILPENAELRLDGGDVVVAYLTGRLQVNSGNGDCLWAGLVEHEMIDRFNINDLIDIQAYSGYTVHTLILKDHVDEPVLIEVRSRRPGQDGCPR